MGQAGLPSQGSNKSAYNERGMVRGKPVSCLVCSVRALSTGCKATPWDKFFRVFSFPSGMPKWLGTNLGPGRNWFPAPPLLPSAVVTTGTLPWSSPPWCSTGVSRQEPPCPARAGLGKTLQTRRDFYLCKDYRNIVNRQSTLG